MIDKYGMSLDELFRKATNTDLPRHVLLRLATSPETGRDFRQFLPSSDDEAADETETIRDSIHLDWSPLLSDCPECGVRVKIWDGFAHRTLWNGTWEDAVAFQPVSTRFETGRWDSPVEGFAFRLWEWDEEQSGDTFTVARKKRREKTTNNPSTDHSTPSSSTEGSSSDEDSRDYSNHDAFNADDDDYYMR